MAKKQMKGKQEGRYYYNEHDDNQVNQLYNRRRKKRRKLRLKRVAFVLAIGLVLGFLVSPYSKVGTITVEGCNYMTSSDILEIAEVSENSFHAFTSANRIEKKLLASGVVKSVSCKRGFFRGLHIEIKEATPLAYQENEKDISLIGQNGEIYKVSKDIADNMNITTRLLNFTDETFLEKFASEYSKVPESIRSLVSDITYCPEEPYDKEKIQFDMNDGKKVFIHDLSNLASEMKYYQEILSTKPDACIYDVHGKNVYASECE